MKGPACLWLIRHEEIDAEPGRCIGWTDIPLSAPSQVQLSAKQFATRIGTARIVYTSDLLRAVQTAEPLADVLKCPLKKNKALRELHFGRWENLTWEEIERLAPVGYRKFMEHWLTEPAPGGESYRDLKGRIARFWRRVLADHENGTIVVVGHGGSLRILIGQIIGMDDKRAMGIPFDRGRAAFINRKNGEHIWNMDPFEAKP